ncbi:tetratricopeptide repeat protein 7B-like isoform X2 [Oscarella lobularis]|uniref:tetratricopeptide repeat protein 7B-like isoform X2 n=1 Tax=Oscarella lobularis TaxID=121494 RepID=UPI0033139271
MTSSKRTKATLAFESDLDRARIEHKWAQAFALLKKKPKGTLSGLFDVVWAESQIQQYTAEHGLAENKGLEAKNAALRDAKQKLEEISKQDKNQVVIEAQILLSKLLFLFGRRVESEAILAGLDLDGRSLWNSPPQVHFVLLVAEAHLLKGLLQEAKDEAAAAEETVTEFYAKSCKLVLDHVKDVGTYVDASGKPTGSPWIGVGSGVGGGAGGGGGGGGDVQWQLSGLVELGLLKLPVLYLKAGNVHQCIKHLRSILQMGEVGPYRSLRLTVVRVLAQTLLRGTCDATYTPPANLTKERGGSSRRLSLTSRQSLSGTKEPPFSPRNAIEETLLVLMLQEAMVHSRAVLSLNPSDVEARKQTHLEATLVYDLYTIALSSREQYAALARFYDRAMKFSFENVHVWIQFALSLISAGRYERALSVLIQSHAIASDNAVVLYQAAKLCVNHLDKASEGIEFATKLISQSGSEEFASRAHLILGVALFKKAAKVTIKSEAETLKQQAIKSLERAHELDSLCFQTLYHLGLQHAEMGTISDALKWTRKALELNPTDANCLRLTALLLSAQKQYTEALAVCDVAVNEWPDNFGLLYLKARLEKVALGGHKALKTCKFMLETWKAKYQEDAEEVRGSGLLDKVILEKRELSQFELASLSGRDARTATSPTQSFMALSSSRHDLASDAQSVHVSIAQSVTRPRMAQAWSTQADVWVLIAKCYLQMDEETDAAMSLNEARLLDPLSPAVLCQNGLMCEGRGKLAEAKVFFESALSLMPEHDESLIWLGLVCLKLGNVALAERNLREAILHHPQNPAAWDGLGVILQSKGDSASASDCFLTALRLDAVSPLLPFSTLPQSV